MILGGVRGELSFISPILDILPFAKVRHVLDVFRRLQEYGRIAVKNSKADAEGGHRTIFATMIHEAGSKHSLSDDLIASEASNITIAGTDTTAVTLTFLIWTVLRRPDIKEKLLKELQTLRADPQGRDLEQLPYLRNVIDETLRLYSAAPSSLPRTIKHHAFTLGRYQLPAGTVVSTQAYTFHRDPAVFRDPETFDPDRWIDPSKEMKEYFIPWGGQARICLGRDLARLELMHGTNMFFKACPDAKVAPTTTEKTMEQSDFFLMAPVSHKCEITCK